MTHLHLVEPKVSRSYRDYLDDRDVPRGPWVVRAPALSTEGTACSPTAEPAAQSHRFALRPTGAGEAA